MNARVSTYAGTPEQAEEGIRNFQRLTEGLQSMDGFEGAYLLVDRGSGRAMTITLWSSEEALQASAERAKQMRQEAAGGAGMSIDTVENYAVAMQIQPDG